MKAPPSNHSITAFSIRSQPGKVLTSLGTLALLLTLGACGKPEEGKTAGQQLDAAIAKTEQAGAEARAKTESALDKAGIALRSATEKAQLPGQDAINKTGEVLDDVAITTAVLAGLARDSDLSALKINVDTKNRAVTLNGSAPSESAREKASAIARGVKGVNSVDNKLLVKAG